MGAMLYTIFAMKYIQLSTTIPHVFYMADLSSLAQGIIVTYQRLVSLFSEKVSAYRLCEKLDFLIQISCQHFD